MAISPIIMNEILRFIKNSAYSIRSGIQLEKPKIHTVQFGSKSTVYLGAKSGITFVENVKTSELLEIFQSKIFLKITFFYEPFIL